MAISSHDIADKNAPEQVGETAAEPSGLESHEPVTREEGEEIELSDLEKQQHHDTREDTALEDKQSPDAAPGTEPERAKSVGEDYSVFTTNQKRMIIIVASLSALFSPMSGSIYYPALNTIASDLDVTASQVNLTVTVYLIVQGLAPMMIAGFSDGAGRRPAYIICFVIYLAANLGLALQDNYAALMVLRCLQSGGSSGTVALAQGVVGDLVTSAERGSYIAFASAPTVLGPLLSPIIGGALSESLGYHSVFWFLFIFAGITFILILLFLPETCRKVVGDGSVPPRGLSMSITDRIRFRNRARRGIPINEEKQNALHKNYKMQIPNPLSTLVVFTDLESTLILIAAGLSVACFYAISTGAATAFAATYGFSDILISLMFIPIGVGGIISAFTSGKMVDWNYRRHARKNNFPLTRNRQQDLTDFPIERARLEIALPLFFLGAVAVLGYGWVMDHKVSLAGPVVLLFVMGYGLTAAFQVLNILMIDIYPGRPATVTAANNIARCELGAAATAAIVPMAKAMGNGWAYTVLALLFMGSSPCLFACARWGMRWRSERKEKLDGKKEKKERKERERAEAEAKAEAAKHPAEGGSEGGEKDANVTASSEEVNRQQEAVQGPLKA